MIGKCPVCQEPMSQAEVPWGILYCRRGHLLTLAPLPHVDRRRLEALARSVPDMNGRLPSLEELKSRGWDERKVVAYRDSDGRIHKAEDLTAICVPTPENA